jgi:glycosyltransferase involved in cell wall biosynthesis
VRGHRGCDPLRVGSTSASVEVGRHPLRHRIAAHPEVGEFVEYLAETFGCDEVVELASEREYSSRSLAHALVVADEFRSGSLAAAMATAAVGVLITPPGRTTSCPVELGRALAATGLHTDLIGWAHAGRVTREAQLMAVFEGDGMAPPALAPDDFRVVAFVPTYNESDIIPHTLQYLTAQGVKVYVIDNWSTDETVERAREFSGRGLIGIERFPPDGPTETYEWRQMLGRVEELAGQIDADWFVLHDADERRHTPWRSLGLRAGLYHVDRRGYNCVDHIVVNFWPTGEDIDTDLDVEQQLRHFNLSDHPGHYHQRKAWKNTGYAVSLASSAGHDIRFPGRLVYPFKFLLKHYPIRSEEHGRRKVLAERIPRWNHHERALGWHRQYEEVVDAGTFLRDPATLEYFEEGDFAERYLVQRLSGVGVFEEPPSWATGPRQMF